jgi:hypothetical protein
MKKIILTAIGLALFATPAAANSHSAFDRADRPQAYTLQQHGPSSQAAASNAFVVAPTGSQSFGLTLGTNPGSSHLAAPRFARPGFNRPHNRPTGWGSPR